MKEPLLGWHVEDKITGLRGITIGYCTYLTGCHQYGVVQKIKEDGTVPDSHWIDEGRLIFISEILTKSDVIPPDPDAVRGGPSIPVQRSEQPPALG